MHGFREALRELPDAVFVDLLESDEDYLLVLDVPGVDADGLDLTVDEGRLRVEGHRSKDVPEGFSYRREERSMFLDAELPLPPGTTAEGATATVRRGVLEVTLPKAGDSTVGAAGDGA